MVNTSTDIRVFNRCSCGGNYRSVIDAAAATNDLPHELQQTVAAKCTAMLRSLRGDRWLITFILWFIIKNLCEGSQKCLSCVYCLGNDRCSSGGKTKTL
jgi:hypothetical protein